MSVLPKATKYLDYTSIDDISRRMDSGVSTPGEARMGGLVQLLPILLIIGVFYILLIRPQQKRQRELQETISQLKAGDRVVTTGGIIGTITNVRDTSFLIRSAEKSILEISRSAVAGIEEEEKK
jgi:preprotein translocase subunit YajC